MIHYLKKVNTLVSWFLLWAIMNKNLLEVLKKLHGTKKYKIRGINS